MPHRCPFEERLRKHTNSDANFFFKDYFLAWLLNGEVVFDVPFNPHEEGIHILLGGELANYPEL
jgi:hypothetical protein